MADDKSQPLVYRFREARKLVNDLTAEIYRKTGLTGPQALVLHALLKQNGISQVRLRESSDLDATTVKNAVEVLVKKRFVELGVDPRDARVNLVSLTVEGQDLGIKLLTTH